MSSGSLKDLTKAVHSSISSPTLPLPDELLEVIHAYLDKHDNHDESDSQKLQDELLAIYEKDVLGTPPRYAAFLAILRQLKRAIQGSGRLLQWWDRLADPILEQMGEEKGLSVEAHHTILNILVYDEDDEHLEDAKESSAVLTENLLSSWLTKFVTASAGELDPEAQFVERNIKSILLEFGRKRPKDFLTSLNPFVVKRDSRIPALSLLVDFIEFQPPHLHQMLQTPLFENLLRCLQTDTSTRAISLAMTATIMFLPHVPSSLASHLPALFNIYSRMLFWDRYRRTTAEMMSTNEDSKIDEKLDQSASEENDGDWEKLPYLLESEDETVPELLHYFTFLYGLYPINFMSYIRKPQRYLRHANFPGADDLDVQPMEIRQRSETFRQLHLLHPNFFTMTIDSELTDMNRWMKSQSADVVAECMALYSPGDGGALEPTSRTREIETLSKIRLNEDVPEQPLLENEQMTPYQSRHNSWRNAANSVASPNGARLYSGMFRRTSQTSFSLPSIADSPTLRPERAPKSEDYMDSPTLAPTRATPSPSHTNVHSMLDSQKSLRGNLQQSLANDSIHSLPLISSTNETSNHFESQFQSFSFSPTDIAKVTERPSESQLVIAYLHRELTLLKNDLSFERYLKQQHLSHIGQLRRKQIREARVEAETQNLINSNRALRNKLDEAKRSNAQMKRESEKSKTHSRKWEADLSAKLRALKEEKKAWNSEGDQLRRDLASTSDELLRIRQVVVVSESKELGSQQKLQSIESNLDELQLLRAEVERLTQILWKHEAQHADKDRTAENGEMALKEVEILKRKLQSRDDELAKSKLAFEHEIAAMYAKVEEASQLNSEKKQETIQAVLDNGLATTRSRVVELQKAHNHLLKRYTALQSAYLDLRDSDRLDEPLLSGGITRARTDLASYSRGTSPHDYHRRARQHAMSDPDTYDGNFSSTSHFPVRPTRLNTDPMASGSSDSRSQNGSLTGSHYQTFSPKSVKSNFALDGGELGEDGKPKIKPQSDVRVYGRGGVQNIGKQPKDKGKKKEEGKDKKSSGIRGIRGFV